MPSLDKKLELDRCPHCSVNLPTLDVVYSFSTDTHNKRNERFWRVYVCAQCGGAVTAYSDRGYDQRVWRYYPHQTMIDDAIDEPAKSYLKQAVDSIHAPSGAIMLCASAVDAMLKTKSYNEGSLYTRINQAAEDHLITTDMAEWAHQVRLDANSQRHADNDLSLPSTEDAKRSLDFALALGEFLFVLPAKVAQGLADTSETETGEIVE